MPLEIFWTNTAIDSLNEIKDFILKSWNQEVLDYFLDLTDNRIELIKKNPNLAPPITGTDYRKLLLHTNASLFYKVEPLRVKILLIWDNRQDPEELSAKLLRK